MTENERVEQRRHVQDRGLGLFREAREDDLNVIGDVAGHFLGYRLRQLYRRVRVIVVVVAGVHSYVRERAEQEPRQQPDMADAVDVLASTGNR